MGLAAVLAGTEPPAFGATSQHAQIITLKVVVDDLASVPPDILEKAREQAARVFQNIDVEVIWLGAVQREDPAIIESVMMVYLFPQSITHRLNPPQNALGMAAGARVATVFYDRIEGLFSKGAAEDISCALGHVIAHEMGHLLLQSKPQSHSPSGIMQKGLNMKLATKGWLSFGASQARQIRIRISANETSRE
jgi:hypothetical protein